MRSFKLFSLVSITVAGFAVGAAADQTSAVTVSLPPVGQGEIHVPAMRTTAGLLQSYVEEEFFVSGLADIYTYNETPVPGEIIIQPPNAAFPQTEDVPYTTRIIVKRPANVEDFSGTLVIEWWNSTAGFDTAPVWDPMAEFAAREGWIYVGVTNSTTSIDFLKGGCLLMGLPFADCQTRYAALDMSENGLAWDMVSQIANMLKNPADPQNPLPAGYTVERLYHAGQSQQGGSMVTYATAFHFPPNDGYFVQADYFARRINYGPVCGDEGAPAYPECTPALTGTDGLVRTDLPVPVIRALTETDVGYVLDNGLRQTDVGDLFRYYEIAGASHVTVHKGIEVAPGLLLESWCLNEMNTLADGQVLGSFPQRAMWKNLDEFVRNGTPMPAGLVLDSVGGVISRAGNGNALGGVRTTDMEVPLARYEPNNTYDPSIPVIFHEFAQLACYLAGSTFNSPPWLRINVFGNHQNYVQLVTQAADALVAQRFLLPEDRNLLIVRAALSDVACGIGFELVFVLPPIMWLRNRRKRRA